MASWILSFKSSRSRFVAPTEDSHIVPVQIASMWHGLRERTEGILHFTKVDWMIVATRRFWHCRNGWRYSGRTGPWNPARAGSRDEFHYSHRCQGSRCIILSLTAAKLASWVSKWIDSSEGSDRKKSDRLSQFCSKYSIKEKPRKHCNFAHVVRCVKNHTIILTHHTL